MKGDADSEIISEFPAMRIQWDETPTQSFEGGHRSRVCVCAFIGMSLCACILALALVHVNNKNISLDSYLNIVFNDIVFYDMHGNFVS